MLSPVQVAWTNTVPQVLLFLTQQNALFKDAIETSTEEGVLRNLVISGWKEVEKQHILRVCGQFTVQLRPY